MKCTNLVVRGCNLLLPRPPRPQSSTCGWSASSTQPPPRFSRRLSLSFFISMKALRKSLNNKDSQPQQPYISTPLPPVSRPSAAVAPPQKVIRATSSYRSPTPQQLSFQRGDFFYVIREVTEGGSWYEAHNPVTGARGIVPKSMFEAFNKGAAP